MSHWDIKVHKALGNRLMCMVLPYAPLKADWTLVLVFFLPSLLMRILSEKRNISVNPITWHHLHQQLLQ